jgi:CRISPR-associated protein Cas2
MLVYIVCYDIEDDDRRRRISDLLERHGTRVQRSVFELAFAGETERETVRAELVELAGLEAKGVRFYRLCATCRSASFDVMGRDVARFGGTIIL